jgi:hypothetical protein
MFKDEDFAMHLLLSLGIFSLLVSIYGSVPALLTASIGIKIVYWIVAFNVSCLPILLEDIV